MTELSKDQVIDKILNYVPNSVSTSAQSVVLSDELLYHYNLPGLGDYVFKNSFYAQNYKYSIYTIEGFLESFDNSSGSSLKYEFSNFGTAVTTQYYAGGVIFEGDFENNQASGGVRIYNSIGEASILVNEDLSTQTSLSSDIGILSGSLEFYGQHGSAAGSLGAAGINAKVVGAEIGKGNRISPLAFMTVKSRNFNPHDELHFQTVYNNLKSSFSNISLTYEEFFNRAKFNYEYSNITADNSLLVAASTVVYDLLKSESDNYDPNIIFANQSGLDLFLNQKSQELPNDFSGHDVVADYGLQESVETQEQGTTLQEVEQSFLDSIKTETNQNAITEVDKNFTYRIRNEDGTVEQKTVNLEERKIELFQTEFADAKLHGIVIAQNTDTITQADGSVVHVTETLFEGFTGERFTEIDTILADGSIVPANGVFAETVILRESGGYTRTTKFQKEGVTHQTQEYQETPDSNVTLRQNILRSDGNGGFIEQEGPIYIVPSNDLFVSLQTLGSTAGGLLANHLADDSVYQQIFYSAVLQTIGTHFGSVGAYLATGSNLEALVNIFRGAEVDLNALESLQLTEDIYDTFTANLQSATAGVLAGVIVGEVGDVLGLEGTVGGDIFDIAAGTVTTGFIKGGFGLAFDGLDGGVYGNLLENGFNFSEALPQQLLDQNILPDSVTTVGDYVQYQIANAIGAYVGSELAGDIIQPESKIAAIFGAAGSAVATAIATGSLWASSGIAGAFTSIGFAGGPIGAAIGAFIGQVGGTLVGNLFGGSSESPASWSIVQYNHETDEYYINQNWGKDGGDPAISKQMAQAVIGGVNDIIEATGGVVRSTSSGAGLSIGWRKGIFEVYVGGHARKFERSGDAIEFAAYHLLKNTDLVGGHAIAMRAWHNSDATSLLDFKADLDVAEAFQIFLLNPAGVMTLMMDQPESDAAQSWAAVLQRANELELHLPHEKDLDGGWNELLLARGDIDPSVIPQIENNSLVLTDPNTGEETVLHHVIGPGYEIVRIEGTDGDDIIEVIVDGPSITHVDAGPGNDVIEGSDERDIILGGAGDDTINGNDGDDWINGGEGNDTIHGNGGLDLIYGGDDNDILYGDEGVDTLYGGDGDDWIDGLASNDKVYGGNGNDTLYGGGGNDSIYGEAGDDIIYGSYDYTIDYLYGGDGDDTIYARRADHVYGGKGDDTIYMHAVSYRETYVYITRGDGHDFIDVTANNNYVQTIRFDDTISLNELWVRRSGADAIVDVLGENQSVYIKNFFNGSMATRLEAQDGNFVYKSNGVGLISISSQNQPNLSVRGGETPIGDDNILSDIVLARSPYYGLVWRPADYRIFNHSIDLNRALDFGGSLVTNDQYDAPYDGRGKAVLGKSVSETASSAYVDYGYFGGAGNDTLSGTKIYGDSGHDTLKGTNSNDILVGGLGNDYVQGYNGNDRIWGAQGDDVLHGNSGNDVIYGGSGADIIQGYNHNDKIYGGVGNDFLYGGSGDDEIYGEEGDDQLYEVDGGINILDGGAGDDFIHAQNGDDFIDGGSGDDFIKAGSGIDIINGGEGLDTASYEDAAAAITIDLSLSSGQVLNDGYGDVDTFNSIEKIIASQFDDTIIVGGTDIKIDGGIGHDTANFVGAYADYDLDDLSTSIVINHAVGNNQVYTLMQIEQIIFSDFVYNVAEGTVRRPHDLITTIEGGIFKGTAEAEVIQGQEGADDIRGKSGDDTLYGGAGDDRLKGGGGDDFLYGEDGFDKLWGRAGADTFVFEKATAFHDVDRIHDFDLSEDVIDISDILDGHYTAQTDSILDFVQLTDKGTYSHLSVDIDGAENGTNFQKIARLDGVSANTDLTVLEANGTLKTEIS